DKAERLIREAARRGAELAVLPEVFSWRGSRRDEAASGAGESIPGPTTERLAAIARELRIHLQSGSILERIDGEPRCYNTALLFSPNGEILARYRKIHLFDVQIPGQVDARESEIRKPGENAVVAETALGKIGLSVCYDLRFPELYRALSKDGAEILCIPSAFTFPTGAAHWEPLIRARAIENQAYVIAPNQYGTSPHGHRDYGSSMIVDPWGTVVARASDGEGVITAELDLEYLAKVRKELPCLRHRRLEG
ncbi:MAG: carbon-nitrogen hydrolase family protein, partial [Candidatus Binatia bacterium]